MRRWPSGDERPIALLNGTLADVAAPLGTVPERYVDDLDYLAELWMEVSGVLLCLREYERAPVKGVQVYADSLAEIDVVLRAIVADPVLGTYAPVWHAD